MKVFVNAKQEEKQNKYNALRALMASTGGTRGMETIEVSERHGYSLNVSHKNTIVEYDSDTYVGIVTDLVVWYKSTLTVSLTKLTVRTLTQDIVIFINEHPPVDVTDIQYIPREILSDLQEVDSIYSSISNLWESVSEMLIEIVDKDVKNSLLLGTVEFVSDPLKIN